MPNRMNKQTEQKFIEAIKENEGILFKVSGLYTDSRIEQEDLIQEITYQIWRSFESFKGNSKLSTWMYRVALNTSIVFLKKKKRQDQVKKSHEEELKLLLEPEDSLKERISSLYEAIKKLEPLNRTIMICYLDEMSYEEIAEITGLSKTNVGTKISRIKNKLKVLIEEQEL